MNSGRTVTIAIGTHNRKELLRRCLEAITAQTYPAELMEVVVVDNESTDGTEEMVKSHKAPFRIKYINQPNRSADASNVGSRLAENDYLFFLDDDVIPHPGTLEAHMKAHSRFDGPAAVIGRLQWPADKKPTPFEEYAGKSGAVMSVGPMKKPDDVHYRYAAHANISISKDVFDKSGGYDEDLYRTKEAFGALVDVAFGYHLKHDLGGRLVYCHDAVADHHHCPSFPEFLERKETYGKAAVIHARKRPGMARFLKVVWVRRRGPYAWVVRNRLHVAYKMVRPLVPLLERLFPLSRPLLFFSYRLCSFYHYQKGIREYLGKS